MRRSFGEALEKFEWMGGIRWRFDASLREVWQMEFGGRIAKEEWSGVFINVPLRSAPTK